MTPDEAALALSCWLCGGPVHPKGKPWRFRCPACSMTIRPDDIGDLQQAIKARAAASIEASTRPPPAKQGCSVRNERAAAGSFRTA